MKKENEKNSSYKFQWLNPHRGELYASQEFVIWLTTHKGIKADVATLYPKRIVKAAEETWNEGCTVVSFFEEVWEAYTSVTDTAPAEIIANQHRAYSQLNTQLGAMRWLAKEAPVYKDGASAFNRYCEFLEYKTYRQILQITGNDREQIEALASRVSEIMKHPFYHPYDRMAVKPIEKLRLNLTADYGKKPILMYEKEFRDRLLALFDYPYTEKLLTTLRNLNTKFFNRWYKKGTPLRSDLDLPETKEKLDQLRDMLLDAIKIEVENLKINKPTYKDFCRKDDFSMGKKAVCLYFEYLEKRQ